MSLREGMAVGNAFMNFGNQYRRVREQDEKDKLKKDTDAFSAKYYTGQKISPAEAAKNPEAYASATKAYNEHQENIAAIRDRARKEAMEKINPMIVSAGESYRRGKDDEGNRTSVLAYDLFHDGFSVKKDDSGNPVVENGQFFIINDATNEEQAQPYTKEYLQQIVQTNITDENGNPDPKKYYALFNSAEANIKAQNRMLSNERTYYVGKDGQEAYGIKQLDPFYGTPHMVYLTKDNRALTQEQFDAAGFTPKDEWQKDQEEGRKVAEEKRKAAKEGRDVKESAALVKEREARAEALTAEGQQRKNIQALIKTGKYTPESVKVYEKTMDVSDLVPAKKPEKDTAGKDKADAEKEAHKVASDFIKEVADFGADAGHIPAYLETTNQRLHRLGQPGFVIEGENARRETAVEFTLSTMAEGEEKNIGGKLYVKRNGQLFEKRKKAGSGRGF